MSCATNDKTQKKRIIVWTFRALVIQKQIKTKPKTADAKSKKTTHGKFSSESKSKTVVYRSYFAKLLAIPKPLRDQLIIELPTLMGFRTSEVCTAQKDHVDLESGDMQVLDSKKHKLFLLPLHPQVAKHLDEHMKNLEGDYLFTRSRPSRTIGKDPHLTDSTIQVVWKKWWDAIDLPYMSPRVGRAYFAVMTHLVRGKSLVVTMALLRHTDPGVTQRYFARIIDYDTVKTQFNEGLDSPFVSDCTRSDCCPLATEGCRCRMFQPRQIEVKA